MSVCLSRAAKSGRFLGVSTKELVAELGKLDEQGLAKFVDELQKHEELAEDVYDLLAFRMRATEPARPFEEFMQELEHPR